MAVLNCKVYVAGYDLTGDHNQVSLEIGVDKKVRTVFGHTATRVSGGMWFAKLSGSGFVTLGAGLVHEVLRSNLNIPDVPITVAADGVAAGSYAEFFKARLFSYQTGTKVGDILPFSYDAESQGDLSVSGTILASGAKTTTGNGTAYQVGAVSATQSIFAALHVLSPVAGSSPTLDVLIQSDNAVGFPSATTRLTFAQQTSQGSAYVSAVGPFTDDWWRASWTIGGTGSPSFPVVVVFGIANNATA